MDKVKGMEPQLMPTKIYQYEIELGHAKSGSDHVLIIKSLKVRGDDLSLVMAELKSVLQNMQEVL